ncbi:50S ribosomal protein L21 [Patescibacteria group bacterium]|nr:50S ribosomal protein L21 [Patescibacteria group bacterium]MBU0776973.1 50S ribosomal protein L21 [Patescibacteria group bacterium]MBU0845579.1 50S ribosomal protein L21 [Patescibacteria group bacterium]MBU0923002.1 50S ribosomal protein L21 [Patescibacteria group bacterium]MBU1066935.1 50S ribosomal protein L21 [Patescibacteria group bacterium]
MKYAVVKIKGQQYRVSEGDEILVDKLGTDKLDVRILLVVDEKGVKIGKPEVKDAKVKIKIISEEEKGKKLYVQTFKAKSRYRRKIGFRPVYSRLLIEKIS